MAMQPCFLVLLFLASISSTAMIAFMRCSAGHWEDVADARKSPVFYEAAKFAVSESKITGLVLERVLEGQIWTPLQIGAETRRFLIETTNDTEFYKVYEGVVTHEFDMNGTDILCGCA